MRPAPRTGTTSHSIRQHPERCWIACSHVYVWRRVQVHPLKCCPKQQMCLLAVPSCAASTPPKPRHSLPPFRVPRSQARVAERCQRQPGGHLCGGVVPGGVQADSGRAAAGGGSRSLPASLGTMHLRPSTAHVRSPHTCLPVHTPGRQARSCSAACTTAHYLSTPALRVPTSAPAGAVCLRALLASCLTFGSQYRTTAKPCFSSAAPRVPPRRSGGPVGPCFVPYYLAPY